MSAPANKMKCPHCGAEMNHHADKVVYGVGNSLEDPNTSGMDGGLHEFHACPACGTAAERLVVVAS